MGGAKNLMGLMKNMDMNKLNSMASGLGNLGNFF